MDVLLKEGSAPEDQPTTHHPPLHAKVDVPCRERVIPAPLPHSLGKFPLVS